MRPAEARPTAWWVMVLSALAIGLIAGFGAVVFRAMIGGFHNLLLLGQFSFNYDANVHTPASPWGPWVILAPVAGAIGVAFLVKTFAPEAKGHGVPEVMDAIYYHDGKIRPAVVGVKSFASALSIGSGGSVGREGPIVQIGSAFGSTLGQLIAMPVRQRAILIAAGAGGGIAGTFNTPIGGLVFAVELMLPVVSPLSLLCVGLSCVAATAVGWSFFGDLPAFDVPALVSGPGVPHGVLAWFVGLGLLMGVAAWLVARSIYWFEDLFDAMPGNYYTRHISGMLLVGLILYGFMSLSGPWLGQASHYYVEGVGYATILDVLGGRQSAAGFLLLLAAAKLLVTCLTLGSGASGGVFSPSLFIGAALGGCVGSGLSQLFPNLGLNPAHFALAGMAALVGASTGAVVTATVMIFEMTRAYSVILPVMLTVVLATAVRHRLSPSTIYTLKLLRRGHVVPQGLEAWRGELRSKDVMTADFVLVSEDGARDENVVREALLREQVVVVTGEDHQVRRVIGVGPPATAHVVVGPDDPLHEVLRTLEQAEARVALVVQVSASTGRPEVVGVISERHIARVACAAARLTG